MENLNLALTINSNGSITSRWSPISGAARYHLYLHTPGNSYVYFNETNLTGTSYTSQPDLPDNQQYKATLAAYNSGGTLLTSAGAQVLIPYGFYDKTPLSVPGNVSAVATVNTVTVKYDAVVRATGYDILFNGTVYSVTGTSKLFEGLSPKTNYTYSVRAKNTKQTGSYSSSKTVTTPPQIPAAPTNMSFSATENSVTITWGAIMSATSYDIMFNNTIYNVTGTTKTISGLSPNVSYTFSIRARNVDGASAYSATRTFTTPSNPPASTNATTNENSVTISWGATAGASSYDLLFNNTTYNVAGTSKTITGLAPNTSYNYQICSKNASGSSSYGPVKSIRTAPSRPASTNSDITKNTATITWDAVAGATSYDILFDGKPYNVTGTSKTFTGLSPGTDHTYAIRSNNAGGSSSYSDPKTIKTLPNPPGVPTNIKATATVNSVSITWDAVSTATSYTLIFGGTSYRVTGTSQTITGLSQNTSYSFTLCANNAGGSGSSSSTQIISTLMAPPAVPTNVKAEAFAKSVRITWDNVSGARSYDVLFNGTVYNGTDNLRVLGDLLQDTNYTYAVRAINTVGASAYSTTQTVRTLLNPPEIPTNISATATANTATISWNAVAGASGYDVKFNDIVYPVTTTNKTITGLLPGKGYYYSVCAKNASGASYYSAPRILWMVPPTPENVTAEAGADSVTVSWSRSNGATSYTLLFNGVSYNMDGASKTITGLNPRTNYSYSVCAKNSSGTSSYSTQKVVQTLIGIPGNIHAEATVDTVTLKFDPVVGATSYDINFNGTVYRVSTTTKEFTGLTSDTSYTYAIRANDAIGSGNYSKGEVIKTLLDIPDMPENVNAESTLNGVMVTWDSVENVTGYDVEFDGEIHHVEEKAKQLSRSRAALPATETPFKEIAGLEPNTEHTYCVRATRGAVSSAYTGAKKVLTKISKQNGLPGGTGNKTYPDGNKAQMALDPVNALTGAFLWSYTFLEDFGKKPIQFTAMYDSQRDEYHKAMGYKWTYSLNYLLYMDQEYAYFSTPYDEVTPFHHDIDKTLFTAVEGHPSSYTMQRREDGFYSIKDRDTTEYLFDSNLCLHQIIEGGAITYRFWTDTQGQISNIIGAYGGSISLSYTNGHITQISDLGGNTVTFAYENNRLVFAVNPNGKRMSFTYDDLGNLLTITDFSGNIHVSNQYDSFHRVVSQHTVGRGDTFASYDETNHSTIFTDELGNTTKYVYDENYRVKSVDSAGSSVQNKYNDKGQLTEQTNAIGHITQMEYDERGRIHRVIHPNGTTEQTVYNDKNYPVTMINRDGTQKTYEYDAQNNLIAVQDERGNTSHYTYDSHNNLVSFIDKNEMVSTYDYDAGHHLKQMKDSDGNSYEYSYDAVGKLLSYTTPRGNTTTYEYSKTGDLISMVDSDGTVFFEYNENGNQTAITDRRGAKQHLAYNQMGQVILATDALGNEYSFTYDAKGRLSKETDPLGYSQTYTYDAMDHCTTVTDGNGNTTTRTFDAVSQLTMVKDAMGGTVTYNYDTVGQVTLVKDPLQNATGYAYDSMGRVTTITNALGDTVTYTYDPSGNLLTKTDESGTLTTYTYENENRLKSIVTNLGTVIFTYDKLGRVIEVQDVDGYSECMQYDAEGNQIQSSDKENRQTTYAYDHAGRLILETDPSDGKTRYEYDANGNCTKITNAGGHSTLYTYDANNQLKNSTNPLGYQISYEYDARGNLASVTDEKGAKTTLTYDGNGNLATETNPLGGVKSYTYDKVNRLIKVQDEEGHTQTFTYDAGGNKTSYVDANQNKWMYSYDALNRMNTVTDQNGATMTMEYQKTGEITGITDPEGAKTTYQYDNARRLIKMSDALEHSLSWTYDSLGRVKTQTDGNGNTTSYQYSPCGNLLSVTDPENNKVTYTYNPLGQITSETDALGNATTYEYDALGQVTAMTNAAGAKTTFTYTANGQIATVTNADGGVTEYTYDACGNLIKTRDPARNLISYEYDAMNNRIQESTGIGPLQVAATLYYYDKKGRRVREINPLLHEKSYTYDGNGNIVTILDEESKETKVSYDLNNKPVSMHYSDGKEAMFRYNKKGDLVELKDWTGTVTMEYGKTGKLAKVTDHNNRITKYTYDANGNKTSIAYPDGSEVHYGYDKNNRVTSVTDAQGAQVPEIQQQTPGAQQQTPETGTQYTYNPAGAILSITQPGSSLSYTYNTLGQPEKAVYRLADGTSQEQRYTYDLLGCIKEIKRTGSSEELTGDTTYTYDAIAQLVSCKERDYTEAYDYDSRGNRIRKTRNNKEDATYQYNALNQLISKTEQGIPYHYTYDKRGNLTEEFRNQTSTKQYQYDAANRMSMGRNLESGEQSEYTYNALYARVKNTQTLKNRLDGFTNYGTQSGAQKEPYRSKETTYVTDYLSEANNDLLSYETGYGVTKAVYGQGYERLSQQVTAEAGTTPSLRATIASTKIGNTYLQSDLLGSPLFASNSQGEVLRYAKRGAWGDVTQPIPEDINSAGIENSLLFTNYSYDPVIEKYFAKARFYDTSQGRMLSKDPVKRGVNAYPYCKSNPVNYVDPTGEVFHIVLAAAGGFALGGLSNFIGSAISQVLKGEEFDLRKAVASAANGAIVESARAMLISTGAGLPMALASNFGAGMLGNAVEQWILNGEVDAKESITSGLTNAATSAIYGKSPFKNAKNAFGRGMGAGAATAGINNISDSLGGGNASTSIGGSVSPYTKHSDPKGGCKGSNALRNQNPLVGGAIRGYASGSVQTTEAQGGGFDLGNFVTDVAVSGIAGGFSSLGLYGLGKQFESLKLSVKGGTDRYINGQRTSKYHELTDAEIASLRNDIRDIGADESLFRFNKGYQTGYSDKKGLIYVKGDVLPDVTSTHPRDLMSSKAVLAHEYYGHKNFGDLYGNRNPIAGAWNDEFRASYNAALNSPNLSQMDRMYLMSDALERAKAAGVNIKITDTIRRILYGY